MKKDRRLQGREAGTPTEAPAPAETAATPAPDVPARAPEKKPSLAERKRAIAAADAELAERVEAGEIQSQGGGASAS